MVAVAVVVSPDTHTLSPQPSSRPGAEVLRVSCIMGGTMARQIETTCPSGLSVTLRGLQGSEINLFANKTEAEQRKIGYDLLSSVVVKVLDPGPAYPNMDPGQPVDWATVVEADRFWLYMFTRVATYGPDYFFRYQCGNGSCRKRFEWGIKLDRDLRQQKLSQESIQAFLNGNEIGPIQFGSDEVTIQLMTGELEDKGMRMQGMKPDEASTIAIANRIKTLNGQEGKGAIHRWVLGLDMMDLLDLTDLMDEHDGGIDTSIEIQCPHCKTIQPVTVPLGVDFWTPDKQLRSLTRKGYQIPEGGGPIRQNSDS